MEDEKRRTYINVNLESIVILCNRLDGMNSANNYMQIPGRSSRTGLLNSDGALLLTVQIVFFMKIFSRQSFEKNIVFDSECCFSGV